MIIPKESETWYQLGQSHGWKTGVEKYKEQLREKIEKKIQDENEHPANKLWNIVINGILEIL